MKITFYGHSSLGIEVGGKRILVDPYISANPNASHININELEAEIVRLENGRAVEERRHPSAVGRADGGADRETAGGTARTKVTKAAPRIV